MFYSFYFNEVTWIFITFPPGCKTTDGNIYLVDSAATHTILKNVKYFSHLIMSEDNVNTISGSTKLIEGSGRANIQLSRGTKIIINNALFSTKSRKNLLTFKDIRNNGFHIETTSENIILQVPYLVRNVSWKNYPLFLFECTT